MAQTEVDAGNTVYPVLDGADRLVQGRNSSDIATASAVTLVSGTANQVDADEDVALYIEVTTGGTITLTFGATSSANDVTVTNGSTCTTDDAYFIALPAGWYVKATLTTTVLSVKSVKS